MLDVLHGISARFADWRRRQRALAELSSLDDRSLADIGITRSDIPYVLSHPGFDREPPVRRPANTNLKHAA